MVRLRCGSGGGWSRDGGSTFVGVLGPPWLAEREAARWWCGNLKPMNLDCDCGYPVGRDGS